MKDFLVSRLRRDGTACPTQQTRLQVNDDGLIVQADGQAEAVLGYSARQLRNTPLARLAASREDNPLAPAHRDRLRRAESTPVTLRHGDGYFFTARIALRPKGPVTPAVSSARVQPWGTAPLDPHLVQVTEETGQLGLWYLDAASDAVHWSDGLYRLLELRPGCDISIEHALFYCQQFQPRVQALFRRCLRHARPFSLELTLLTANQRLRPVRLSGRPILTGDRVTAVAGTLVDLSERLHQRAARTEVEQILHGMMDATDDLVLALGPTLNILACNRPWLDQFERTFGDRPQVGDSLCEVLAAHPNERRLNQRLWEKALQRKTFTVEMPLAQQERDLPVYEIRFRRLLDTRGQVLGAVQIARDISHRLRTRDHLNYLSQHDPMTGLLNRRELLRRLQRAIDQDGASGGHALFFLDLDHVTRFNDRAGAGACDRYLRELATMLGSRVRQRDALARVSADKFALLLDRCPEAEARRVANTLTGHIGAFVFDWEGERLQTTASGGLVPFGGGYGPDQAETLLALAADLCQTAKDAGRDRIHVYRDPGHALLESEAQARLEDLKRCVREDRIALMFQRMRPVSQVTWGDHVEILARLELGDEQGFWLPNDFLPVAERFDLVRDIDRRVIHKTLDWLRRHPLLEPRLKLCSFNLSLASLLDEEFATFLEDELSRLNLPPGRFCFEIREGDATQYPDEAAVFCDTLHKLGCQVALDGAGASVESFSLAARLPVDLIKLDHGLMRELAADPVQQVMVEALHRIAETAGKKTVAPFIEDDDTLRQVRRLGIHFGQGFRLSGPQPLAELAPVPVELSTGTIGAN
ncbi:EAL domain-containing protein [Marinobacter bohaiensis]|uniref:EAL domain-containing protein n=1 Tax=Marinobacter bohaiensis TaxID=2201898 RepID=UPI000DADA3D7|nr:EAL domain-containing protein [Marinobacter bohaiensis]